MLLPCRTTINIGVPYSLTMRLAFFGEIDYLATRAAILAVPGQIPLASTHPCVDLNILGHSDLVSCEGEVKCIATTVLPWRFCFKLLPCRTTINIGVPTLTMNLAFFRQIDYLATRAAIPAVPGQIRSASTHPCVNLNILGHSI